MTLADGQFSYNGLIFGDGCDILVNSADGFEGYSSRTSDSDQPRGDGAIRGLDYVSPRTVGLELNIWEPDIDGALYEQFWSLVRATFRPRRSDDLPLVFKRPGQPEQMIRCRPIQLNRVEKWNTFNRYGYPPVTLRAVDPRIYSTEVRTGNVPVYASTSGGFDFPTELTGGVDFVGGTQIEFAAQNDGTADAFPLVRFYGPKTGTVTAVKLTNTTTGQELVITGPLLTGQILTADMEAAVSGADRPVISLDGSGRYGWWALPRSAFVLAPGSNTIRFQVTGSSTDAVCNLTWCDTCLD